MVGDQSVDRCRRNKRFDDHWCAGDGLWHEPRLCTNGARLRDGAGHHRHFFGASLFPRGDLFALSIVHRPFGRPAGQTAAGLFLLSETLAAGVRVYVASIPIKLMLGDKLLGLGTGDPILGAIVVFVGLVADLHLYGRR